MMPPYQNTTHHLLYFLLSKTLATLLLETSYIEYWDVDKLRVPLKIEMAPCLKSYIEKEMTCLSSRVASKYNFRFLFDRYKRQSVNIFI